MFQTTTRPASIAIGLTALTLISTWAQAQSTTFKLTSPDVADFEFFGRTVAISGDTAIIGAPAGATTATGSAYVFVHNGTTWEFQEKLISQDSFDNFGQAVAIDGDTAVVGAHSDDEAALNAGAAYVFVRTGTSWTRQDKLIATDAEADDTFGAGVTVAGDTVVVGAVNDDDLGNNNGSAYVFVRSGSSWSQQGPKLRPTVLPDGVSVGLGFGRSVAISGDTAVIGVALQAFFGSAYLFVRNGTSWSQQAELLGTDIDYQAFFGRSVAISGDTAVIGAQIARVDGSGSANGAAYVFVRSGTVWSQQDKLIAGDGSQGDQFGFSVGLSGDTAVVGAIDAAVTTTNSGSAYAFVRSGTSWTQQSKLVAANGDVGGKFGIEVAVSGNLAIVGFHLNSDLGSASGAAYVFELEPANLPPTAVAGPDQSIHAGQTVLLDGSASFDDNTASATLLYDWSFVATPEGSSTTLSGAATTTPSFVADQPGMYIVQLIVTDEEGLTSAPDEVVVSSTNIAPTADAGDDVGGVVGFVTTLDGTGTTDPQSDPLTFSWTIVQTPAGSLAILDDADIDMPSFVPDVAGIYVVRLVVNDGFEDSEEDDVAITVISGAEFCENVTMDVLEYVGGLPLASVTTKGNQNSLTNFLSQVIVAIQAGDLEEALSKLDKAISRTDGCVLRGEPDTNGPELRDWITDCDDQLVVYSLLTVALTACSPP